MAQPHGGQFPMQQQPGAGQQQMMPAPAKLPGCPPGLEYLAQIDQLLVHQKVELLEALSGWETNNHYIIKNTLGQQVYRVDEETGMCMRQCCGPARGFTLHIIDNMNQEVMRVVREFKCCAGCCWCATCDACSFEVRVEAPVGQVIGYTRQTQSCWKITLNVLDEDRKKQFLIRGPCCPCGFSDIDFPVLSKDETREIGMIKKQWTGFVKEAFTDADNFGITFPIDLDVKLKGALIGALFLVDFMAFEKKKNNNH